jgi:hypothetical protein
MLKQVCLLLTCMSGHIEILILISQLVFVPATEREPTFTSCHLSSMPDAQTGQSSAHLRVRAYPDLDSHFKVVSVPATER